MDKYIKEIYINPNEIKFNTHPSLIANALKIASEKLVSQFVQYIKTEKKERIRQKNYEDKTETFTISLTSKNYEFYLRVFTTNNKKYETVVVLSEDEVLGYYYTDIELKLKNLRMDISTVAWSSR